MREIVFDTETTGLDPAQGHRVVEIGAVEISNLIPTGRVFHVYINPERDMPEEAFRVHGLSNEFLLQHKPFAKIVAEFIDFIEDAPLVAHNAEFDTRFLNAELALVDRPALAGSRIIDTLAMARRLNPGSPAHLMRCVSVMASTALGVINTARFLMLAYWRKSMLNCAEGVRQLFHCRRQPAQHGGAQK